MINQNNFASNQPNKNEAQQNLQAVETEQAPVAIGYTKTQFEVINALYDSKIFSKIKLTAGARLVLIALARHYNPANEDAFPSYTCIAEHTGVSRKSVERGIKELVNAKLITYRTQKVNRYRFTGYFFTCVNLSVDERQNDGGHQRQNVAQTNNHEKINNRHGRNFKKEAYGDRYWVERGSRRIPSVEETRAYLAELEEARKNAGSPLDYDPQRALQWYNSLNDLLKTSVMAKKVAAKFGFN